MRRCQVWYKSNEWCGNNTWKTCASSSGNRNCSWMTSWLKILLSHSLSITRSINTEIVSLCTVQKCVIFNLEKNLEMRDTEPNDQRGTENHVSPAVLSVNLARPKEDNQDTRSYFESSNDDTTGVSLHKWDHWVEDWNIFNEHWTKPRIQHDYKNKNLRHMVEAEAGKTVQWG